MVVSRNVDVKMMKMTSSLARIRDAVPKQREEDAPGNRILRLEHDERSHDGYVNRILPYVPERRNLSAEAAKPIPICTQKKRYRSGRTKKLLSSQLKIPLHEHNAVLFKTKH
ncbi:hypothetical protein MRX96_031623 [Rhipicephalus microplus]